MRRARSGFLANVEKRHIAALLRKVSGWLLIHQLPGTERGGAFPKTNLSPHASKETHYFIPVPPCAKEEAGVIDLVLHFKLGSEVNYDSSEAALTQG